MTTKDTSQTPNLDRALLPRTTDGLIIPFQSFADASATMLCPRIVPDAEGLTPAMLFESDFKDGSIPGYIEYVPGYDRPEGGMGLGQYRYCEPRFNLSPNDQRILHQADTAAQVQPRTAPTPSSVAIHPAAFGKAYEDGKTIVEPRADGLYLIETDKEAIQLSNFIVSVLERQVRHARGQSDQIDLKIEVRCKGNKGELIVKSSELDSLLKAIQSKMPIATISTSAPKAASLLVNYTRSLIDSAPTRDLYTTTGFERIQGRYIYVHDAATPPDPTVEFQTGNTIARAPGVSPNTAFGDVMAALELSQRPELMVPLVLLAHLAPLFELFDAAGHVPRFVLFLNGTTGSLKTSVCLALFRLFSEQADSPEANFHDTQTGLELKLANAHSRVVLVDDFQPPVSASSGKAKLERLEMVIRFAGDRIGKARGNSDLELRDQRPLSCCCVVTGEDTGGSQSSLLRCLVLAIQKGDIDGKKLKRYQDNPLLLQTHFYYFLDWCGANGDRIIALIRDGFESERELFSSIIKEPRLIDTGVTLHLVARVLIEYGTEIRSIQAPKTVLSIWTSALCEALRLSELYSTVRDPAAMFLTAIFDLHSSGKLPIAASAKTYCLTKDYGYVSGDTWWLRPADTFKLVVKYWREFGVEFPLQLGKVNELLGHHSLIQTDSENLNDRVKTLYTRKSSVAGRPRMMVLNISAVQKYLESRGER